MNMAKTDKICFGFPSPLMDVMDGSSPLRTADVQDFAGNLRHVASIYLKTVDEPPSGLTPEEALRALTRIAPQRLTEQGMTEAVRHRLLHAVHERIQREDAKGELPTADPDALAQHESGMDHFLLTDVRSVLVSTAGAEFSRYVTDEELDAAVQQVKRTRPPLLNTRAQAEAAVQELLNGGPVLLRGGGLGDAGDPPVHQHVRRFANTSHAAVQGADYDFVSPPVQHYLETGGYTLGSQGVVQGRRSPWGDQPVFVVRAIWDDDFGKVVLLADGEVEAKHLHEFADIVSRDPELIGLEQDVPIVMVINAGTPRVLWGLARFTALMTDRTVWFTSQRSSFGADPHDTDSVVINLPDNESGRWAKVLPSDMREMDSGSSLNSHSGPVADGDIRLDVIVDFDTKRPVGAFSHSPEETLEREERLQILSDVSTYSQGVAHGGEIVGVPGGERPVPWSQDTWFWMSHGVPGYAVLQKNGDAREPLYVNAQEFGAFMARFLREQPLSVDTRIVLVVCYGATLAQAVADATGRVVYAAHTQVGGSFSLDRQESGQEQLWLSFPPRPPEELGRPDGGDAVRAYPVHVDSPSGDDISRRALRDRLATLEPGTPGYERVAKALATWETANTRPRTATVPDADRNTAQVLVDGHYPGATIEHVSPTVAGVLDRLMRERPSGAQERPAELSGSSERQPDTGHEAPAPETAAAAEATVDTVPGARRAPVYPTVDPVVRARWADRFAEAKELLGSLPEERREQLLEQAAGLMNGRHQAPPIIPAEVAPGSAEAEYKALFEDMAALVAAHRHTDPRPELPLEEQPAWLLSEELRADFGTRAVTGLPGGMHSTSRHGPVGSSRSSRERSDRHAAASSSRQGQQSSAPARSEAAAFSYGKMGPEFETEWIIDRDLSHGDRLARLGAVTLTAEKLRTEAPTTLEIVGAPIAFRGEADGVSEDDIWRSLDTVMRSLRPGPAVKHLFRGQSGFRALEHGGAGLAKVAPGREFNLSPQWTVGMPASELLDFIMDDVKALSVKSADTAHADAEAGAAFAKETAALFYSATRRTTISNPWLAWETLDDADYRSVAGLLLLVFLQAITPVHVEDNRSAGKKSANWFKSYTFIASRHDPRTLADALPPHARDFLNENHSSVLRSFSKHARSALSDRYSGSPLDANLLYKGLTVRDYLNSFLLRHPDYAVSQEVMAIATIFGELDGGKPLVELRNLADVEGVAQAREQYEDLKQRTHIRYEAAARRAGLSPGHHGRMHVLQADLAGSELAGSLERLLRITGELNLAHHQRSLGFELLQRTAVKPLVRSLLRLHGHSASSAEQGHPHGAAALRKLDAELVEFAYTLNLFDHAGRSWTQVRGKWAQAMQDTATLRQALSQESVNWPPPEAMHNWKELSALPGMRPRTNLKDIDSAVRTALAQPGDTAALQDILFKVTEWRHHHQGSKREGAIEQLERFVLHQLAGRAEHIARPSAPRQTVPTSSRLRSDADAPHHTGPLRTTGSRAESPRYPVPSPEVLEEWSERIRYARDYLREVPDADQLRQRAASIVAAHLLAPPAASERLSENARAYGEHYRGAVEVVASLLGRDRARSEPARRAVQVAQDMANAFGNAGDSRTTVAPGGMPPTGLEPPARERAWRAPAAPTAEESAVAAEAAYAHLIARHLNAPRVDVRGLLATLQRRGSTPSLFTPTSLRTVFQQVTGADLVTSVNAAVLQGRLSMDNHHEVLRGLGIVSDFFFADESPQEDVDLPSAHYGSRSPDVVAYVRQVHRAYASNDPERVLTLLRDLDRDMRKVWAVEAAWQERYGAPLRQSLAAVWPGYADRVGHVLGDVDDSPVPMAQAEMWYRQLHMVTFEHPERGIVPVTTEYPDEGCYLRAHLWARELLRWGAAPRKAIGASARLAAMSAHARGATAATPKQVQWRYHVAPVVNVFGAHGAVVPIVLDPTLGLGPLPVREWARAIGLPAVSGGQDVFEGPLDQVHAQLAEQQRQNPGNWQFAERKLPVRPMLLLTDGHAFRFPYPDKPHSASWQETDALVQQEEDSLFLHHFRAVRRDLARRMQGLFQQVTDAHTSEQVLEALKAEVAPYLPQEDLLEGFLQGYPDVEVTARRLLSDAHYDEFEGFFPPPENSEEHADYSSEEETESDDEMFLDEDQEEEPGPARRSPERGRGWEPPASWTAPPLGASPTEAEAHGAAANTQGVELISWADLRRRAEPAAVATEVFDPLRSGPYEPGRLPGAMSEVLLDARRFQTASGEWISDATVRVHLAPHGVSADDTRFLAERMTGAVRRLVNEPRFRLPDGSVFHFSVEFLARPETAHHVMAVHAEPGVTTTAEVHLVDGSGTPLTEYQLVHEFLHFLGLPDRYFAPGHVFRDRPWSGRVALDGSLTAGEPVEGLPVLNAEDLAAIGQVFSSGPVIRDLVYPSAGRAEDTSAPGSPDLTGDVVPSPGVRRDAAALIEEFDAGIRPALRVWEDPVTDEFDRLTDEVLTDWGSRSLVFGLHEGPLWVINMEGAFRILTEDGLPVSLPKTVDGPVVSLDIGTDGRLVGPAANLPGGDAGAPLDTKAGFCEVNLGADLSRVLGRSPANRR